MSTPSIRCPKPGCGRELLLSRSYPAPLTCPKCGSSLTAGAPAALPPPLPRTGDGPTLQSPPPRSGDNPTLQSPPPRVGAPAPHPALPTAIGRFQIRGKLGEGAFGVVFRAYDPQLDRDVALKVAKPGVLNTPGRVERFEREARAAAKFRHPHIVPVYDSGRDGPRHFIASGFIEGRTLREEIEGSGGRFDLARAAALVRQLAEALAYAHARGVVHRDVKPENVLIDTTGAALVTDFGLASRVGEGARAGGPDGATGAAALATRDGELLGTPAYMSPEQAAGKGHEATAASDQYALGVVLYEMATGRRPFEGPAVLFHHIETAPAPPRAFAPHVPRDLEAIVLRCLQKAPARRYASCADLAADLTRYLDGAPVLARPAGVVRRADWWYRRNRKALRVGIPVALVLLCASSVFAYRWFQARGQNEELGGQIEGLAGEVDTARKGESAAKEKADEAARLELRQKYGAELQQFPGWYSEGRLELIRERLAKYAGPGAEDVRGFEWDHWNRRVADTAQTFTADARPLSLEWSANGRALFATDATGQVLAWDVATGARRKLRPTETLMTALAGDPLDRWVVGISRQGQGALVQFDPVTGAPKGAFPTVAVPFAAAVVSPDGQRLATVRHPAQLDVFDAKRLVHQVDITQKNPGAANFMNPLAPGLSHNGRVRGLAIAPDNNTLATAGEDRRIGLWDLTTGKHLGWLDGHQGDPVAVAFSPDGTKLVSRALGRVPRAVPEDALLRAAPEELIVWRVAEREAAHQITLAPGSVAPEAELPDKARVLGGNYRAEFLDNGRSVATGNGTQVTVWDVATGRIVREFKGHERPIVCVRASRDGTRLASADAGGAVKIWNVAAAAEEVVATLDTPGRGLAVAAGPRPLVLLHDSGLGGTGGGAETVSREKRLSHLDPNGANRAADVSDGYVCGLTVGPGGERLAVVTGGVIPVLKTAGAVAIYDARSGKLVRTVPLTGARCAAFRTEDELFVVRGTSAVRHVLSTGQETPVPQFPAGESPELNGTEVRIPGTAVMCLAFAPDGRHAVAGTADGQVIVYDASAWTVLKRCPGHSRGVTQVAFSPDGRRLASCSGRYFWGDQQEALNAPGEVIVWDTRTWASCLTLGADKSDKPREFAGVGFSADGRALYAIANPVQPGNVRQPRGEVMAWGNGSPAASAPAPADGPGGTVLHIGGPAIYQPEFVSCAVHPSGRFVAATTLDQLVLWDVPSKKLLRSVALPPSFAPHCRATFSADGEHIVLCIEKRAVRVFTTAALAPVAERLPAPAAGRVLGAGFRSDDKTLLTIEEKKDAVSLRIGTSTGAVVGLTGDSRAAAFSRDCGSVAVLTGPPFAAPDRGEWKLFVAPTATRAVRFSVALAGPADEFGFTPDGRTLFAVVPNDKNGASLLKWDGASGKALPTVPDLPRGAVSPDGRRCLHSEGDQFFATETGAARSRVPVAIHGGVGAVGWFPDGTHFATAGKDKTVRIWSATAPPALDRGALFLVPATNFFAASADGRVVVCCGRAGNGVVCDLTAGTGRTFSLPERSDIAEARVSGDGKRVVLCPRFVGPTVYVVDVASGRSEVAKLDLSVLAKPGKGPGAVFAQVHTATARGDGSLVALISESAPLMPVTNYSLLSGNKAVRLAASGTIKGAWFAPDAGSLAVHTTAQMPAGPGAPLPPGLVPEDEGAPSVARVDATTGKVLGTYPLPEGLLEPLGFAPDGKRFDFLISRPSKGSFEVARELVRIDLTTGAQVKVEKVGRGPVALSPDGRRVAIADGGAIRVLDATTTAAVGSLKSTGDTIHLRFLSNDRLLSIGSDNAVRLWDLTAMKPADVKAIEVRPAE